MARKPHHIRIVAKPFRYVKSWEEKFETKSVRSCGMGIDLFHGFDYNNDMEYIPSPLPPFPPMKAIIYYAPGDMRYEDTPLRKITDTEVLVKTDACAVCGTDLKSFISGNPRLQPPIIIGHEFTGIVTEVGKNAAGGLAVGDRVVMATSVSCGECAYCRRGWRNLCENLAPMGFSYPGGMAEYTILPARALENGHVIKTPAGMKPEHAALAEPVSCAVNSVTRCGISGGETVLVMGAGPMGLLNAVVARAFGAAKVMLSEVNPARIAQAEAFGLDVIINPETEDLLTRVMQETGGLGADVVIVAAPAAAPQELAPHLCRKRGVVCLFASLPKGKSMLTVDSRPIHYGELSVIGTSDSTPEHVRRAVELLASGAIPAEKIASHLLPLSEIQAAFSLMKSGESLRVVMMP